MVIIQRRSRRKATSGRYKAGGRSKRQFEAGSAPTMSTIGEKKVKAVRIIGNNVKSKLIRSATVNVIDQSTKKAVKATLKEVVENKANKFFIRRNILTKGAVVDTDKGKVKITNRPGQDGNLNGVIVK